MPLVVYMYFLKESIKFCIYVNACVQHNNIPKTTTHAHKALVLDKHLTSRKNHKDSIRKRELKGLHYQLSN